MPRNIRRRVDSTTATGSATRRSKYKFLLHDRHKTFSVGLDEEVASWGIEVLNHGLMRPRQMPSANDSSEASVESVGLCDTSEGSLRRTASFETVLFVCT